MNLSDEIKGRIANMCSQHSITAMILYGSMVAHEAEAEDADVMYFSTRKLSFNEYSLLISSLQELLGKEKIDLVFWNDAYPLLRNEVALRYQLLFGDFDFVEENLRAGQRMFWENENYYEEFFAHLKQRVNAA